MILLGIGVGMGFGWHRMDSLFLGGMIAMSSTTIIYKAFDDLGLRKKQFTGLVLSILILEDILALSLIHISFGFREIMIPRNMITQNPD